MKKAEAYWPLIMLLAIIKFVLPIFLQSPVYELQRDEYLYFEQGQNPAFGYLENPPLLSWLGTISSWLGGAEAMIKLWPCLFGAATLVITCLITAELGGKIFAQFMAGLGIITGAYMRIHFLYQPNILDIFFWVLAVYFLIRYINTQDQHFIFGVALSLVGGFWSKYSILFIAAAIIIGLLASPYRNVFIKRKTWYAVLLALLLISPNLWWQYAHNWPIIHHMDELRETQLRHVNKTDFIKEQFLLLFPVLFVWITGLVWLLRNSPWRILAIIYTAVITLLLVGSGKSYYTLGAYPMLLAAGSVAIERWSVSKNWFRYTAPIGILILTIPFIPMLLPVWKPERLAGFYTKTGMDKLGLLKWEDLKDHELPQDFADMLGWKELTAKTEKFYSSLPDTVQNNTIIFGRHYGHAGSLKFYGESTKFKKRVFTDVGTFLLWIPDDLPFRNLILLARQLPGPDDEVFNHFEKVSIIDSVTNPYSRQFGDKIIFFERIDSAGMLLAKKGLQEMKRRFIR